MARNYPEVTFFLTIVLLFSCSPAHAITTELTRLESEFPDRIEIGVSVFNVFEGISVDDEVLAFGFDVTVSDTSLVYFVGADVLEPLFQDDSDFFPNTDVAGSAFPGLTDDILALALLKFDILNDFEEITIEVTSDIMDPNEGLIYLFSGSAEIAASLTVVSEPSSMALMMFAPLCFGLACWRSARSCSGGKGGGGIIS